MPIRNMWSLNPGEVLVAEQIRKRISDCQVYFPLNDVGIDLLVVRGQRHCGVQVKESRYYRPERPHSWHQIHSTNLEPSLTSKKQLPDVYVFLTYYDNQDQEGMKKPFFKERYLIVPPKFLKDRLDARQESQSNGKYSLYFSFDEKEKRVLEIRKKEKEVDYTEFWGKWDLIDKMLSAS